MFYFLGLILLAVGGVMLVPIPAAFIFNEISVIPYFLLPSIVSLGLGLMFWRAFDRGKINYGKAMVVAALGWLLVSFFGSIPFIFAHDMSFLNAYFESMSGFTTTGLTMFEMPGPGLIDASHTVLFWRSFTQWIGGMGIMILFLSAIVGGGKVVKSLYTAEGGGGRTGPDARRNPEATVRSSAKSTWKIYVFYTIVAIILLYLVGMPLFESINHAMTALATGGFSVTSDSFASYGLLILIVTSIPMIIGATSFATHREILGGGWKSLINSSEFRLMIVLIAASTFVLGLSMNWFDAFFSSVTASTTVGFSSVGKAGIIGGPAWGSLQKSILIVLMVVGGGFGSTAGAIKLIRTVVLVMSLYWLIKSALLPDSAVVPFRIEDRTFPKEAILQTAIFSFAYIVLLVEVLLLQWPPCPQKAP